jgi:hypothetical protein
MQQIDVDVPRTFGGHRHFQNNISNSLHTTDTKNTKDTKDTEDTEDTKDTKDTKDAQDVQSRKQLGRVLKCYAVRNPGLGYCQSMNLIVGLFLSLRFEEETSFWLLTELAERIVPGYWVPSMTDTQVRMQTYSFVYLYILFLFVWFIGMMVVAQQQLFNTV